MLEIKIKNKNYKVQFGYNQFIDTDLMDRVKSIVRIMISTEETANEEATAEEVTAETVESLSDEKIEEALKNFDLLKEVFSTTRELIFVGFQKHNPLHDILEAGYLMDDYDGKIQELFMLFVNELFSAGFMGDLIGTGGDQVKKKTPKRKSA